MTDIATRYALTDLMDWAPPYNKSLEKLKIFLKCVSTYLSRGNVEAQLDAWLQDAAEGNLAEERAALIAGAEDSSVAAMIRISEDMVETVGYADTKMILGDGMVVIFNHYNNKLDDLDGLGNEVIRDEQKQLH